MRRDPGLTLLQGEMGPDLPGNGVLPEAIIPSDLRGPAHGMAQAEV